MTETTFENTHSEHIFVIQQFKDEILELQKKCSEKDKTIFERDKKIAELNSEIIVQEQRGKLKMTMIQKEHNESIQSLHDQIRALNKQVPQSCRFMSVEVNGIKAKSVWSVS
ncbi:unnamed protein product [Gongylonema pulchrum]|uniref:Coiled-coil domain-containing protein 39 n=1 Tax=Gongylonema pulchrum TaxID=637853 RepID=A0A183DXM3_9BILA|nr:unnamed protein product [Gongylonema pulchrum]